MRIIALIFVAALASVGAAAAQSQADPVAQCRAAHAADPAAHISCLENAITAMRAAPAPQAAESEPQRRFVFSPSERAEQTPAINVRIVQVSYNREGLGRFVTDEGQIWRETTAAPQRRRLEFGETYEAEISRSAFGGFRMNIDGIRWEYKVEPLT